LSECNIAFLACPVDLADPAPAIDWLLQSVGKQGPKNAAKFVAVNTKFKAPHGISTFNAETNYPIELARLATHANWAKTSGLVPQQYRDAQALVCLHRLVQARPDIERIVLIVEHPADSTDPSSLLQSAFSKPFYWFERDEEKSVTTNPGPILFDRTNPNFDAALKLALDIALTGAIYGLDPYSFDALLDQSTSAATMATHRVPVNESGLKS
jgi:hypothetical protein